MFGHRKETDVYSVRNRRVRAQGELLPHDCRKHLCACFSVPMSETLGLRVKMLASFPHTLTAVLWALEMSFARRCLEARLASLHALAQRDSGHGPGTGNPGGKPDPGPIP